MKKRCRKASTASSKAEGADTLYIRPDQGDRSRDSRKPPALPWLVLPAEHSDRLSDLAKRDASQIGERKLTGSHGYPT